jgi:hypothetical protein
MGASGISKSHDAPAEHPGGEVLVTDRLRQPDPLDARYAQRYPRAGSQSYPSTAQTIADLVDAGICAIGQD